MLADRAKIVQHRIGQAYPQTRKSRMTYSGSGYSDGYAQGQRADLDGARLAAKRSRALGSGDR